MIAKTVVNAKVWVLLTQGRVVQRHRPQTEIESLSGANFSCAGQHICLNQFGVWFWYQMLVGVEFGLGLKSSDSAW